VAAIDEAPDSFLPSCVDKEEKEEEEEEERKTLDGSVL